MTRINDLPLSRLQFYVTTQYPCGYLEDRQARSMVAAPAHLIDTPAYNELVKMGFRRSGPHTYRPHCDTCLACVPVRLRIHDFKPGRTQRRIWKHHAAMAISITPLKFEFDHFELYASYQQHRHPGGGMDLDGEEQYRNFLLKSGVDTVMVEFRENGKLRMVSIVDCLADGLSAVYAFYDTAVAAASFGTYNVLWLADWCRRLELPYLYLGYWIAESRKMSYKARFMPLEQLQGMEWHDLRPDENRPAPEPMKTGR